MRGKLAVILFLMAVLVIGGCGGSGVDQSSTTSSQNLDFVLFQADGDYVIEGTVFDDLNGNGTWDTAEVGVPGVAVDLVGVAGTVTDTQGMYAFGVAAAGAYTVQVTVPNGYVNTTDTEVAASVAGSVTTVNFGLQAEVVTYSIFGFVFSDMNGNGVMDSTEWGIPDAVVTLDGIDSQMTGTDGSYAFAGVEAGPHTVEETDPTGYVSTTPNSVTEAVVDADIQIDFGDWPIQPVSVDVKPGSDINPINLRSKGVTPVAILGSADFDVMEIDPTTLLLNGVAPLRWSYEDVCTRDDDPGDLDHSAMTADGYVDLTLKFSTQEIAATLGEVQRGDIETLKMTGELIGGRPAEGEEMVWIVQVQKD